jgi:hypothetical protein
VTEADAANASNAAREAVMWLEAGSGHKAEKAEIASPGQSVTLPWPQPSAKEMAAVQQVIADHPVPGQCQDMAIAAMQEALAGEKPEGNEASHAHVEHVEAENAVQAQAEADKAVKKPKHRYQLSSLAIDMAYQLAWGKVDMPPSP